MKIKAAIQLNPTEKPFITKVELSEPRADEVLVKIVACGVCHTDISMRDHSSYYPTVLGMKRAALL